MVELQVSEGMAVERTVELTPPLSLDGGMAAKHQEPNLVRRAFSLFLSLQPGSDLTKFQLPALFNMPKSQLQCYGESVYCIGENLLSRCAKGGSSLQRFISVLAWSISTTRPPIFGLAPFNPILGETHHVSNGSLNILLEQVSHHPPVSALHATDATENIEILWWQRPVPKFNGANWEGNVRIRCKESNIEAELCYYNGCSFLGLRGSTRSVKGVVFHSKTRKTIYEINGHWDRVVTLNDVQNRKSTVLYNAKEAIFNLKTPILKNAEGLLATESAVVWSEVNQSLLKRNWKKAREAKKNIEDRERRVTKERMSLVPKYFTISQAKEGSWECHPKNPSIPSAPIIVSQSRLVWIMMLFVILHNHSLVMFAAGIIQAKNCK